MAPNLAQNKTFILYKIPRRLLGAKSSLSQVPGTQVTRVTRQTSLTLLAPQQTPVIVEVCRKQHRGIKGSREKSLLFALLRPLFGGGVVVQEPTGRPSSLLPPSTDHLCEV